LHALLLSTDGQVWQHGLDPEQPIKPQILSLLHRRQGLITEALDDGSHLYYGGHMPTLANNSAATEIAANHTRNHNSIHGRAVLLTTAPDIWIERAIVAHASRHLSPAQI